MILDHNTGNKEQRIMTELWIQPGRSGKRHAERDICYVTLIQQGVWAMALESMPLGIGYLKAAADHDPRLRGRCVIEIANFGGADTVTAMAHDLFSGDLPDVLAVSVFGWSYRGALSLAATFKQLNPAGWVVFGGTHVANQGGRVLGSSSPVDVIVDGEGEHAFCDLLAAWLDDRSTADLSGVDGITYLDTSGSVTTTTERPRIEVLDDLPSPFLTGAIPMRRPDGRFRYDVAIMETNRGCPYKCSFCFWGGAIGQRVRRFSRERLAEELELFAFHEVETIVLCDANFGLQQGDEEFLEDAIHTRERTGFPRAIEASWAKNKSAVFRRIVRTMKSTGMRSSITLALQSLNGDVLGPMNRRNMRLNDWQELVTWLTDEGLDCYAELIWGAPGDTVESFLHSYDELSRRISRIATYPLLILPNTEYERRRDEYGLVTVRGDADDFEYVIGSSLFSVDENHKMQGFLLWARAVAENSFLRHIWHPLRELAGLRQSEIIISLADWFDGCEDAAAVPLRRPHGLVDATRLSATIRYLFEEKRVCVLFERWWEECVAPRLREGLERRVLGDVFRLDLLTRPLFDPSQIPGVEYLADGKDRELLLAGVEFSTDVVRAINTTWGQEIDIAQFDCPTTVDIRWKDGFVNHFDSHEVALQFVGKVTRADVPGRREVALSHDERGD
jgi:radical SAM superfamily enzyme YgiQ (UPF0313 family)